MERGGWLVVQIMMLMRLFSSPLALKYLKIRSQVPFAFNKILIFFNRGSPK